MASLKGRMALLQITLENVSLQNLRTVSAPVPGMHGKTVAPPSAPPLAPPF
jgi:hypothetical protein